MFSIHHYCFWVIAPDTSRILKRIRPCIISLLLFFIITANSSLYSQTGSAGKILITREYNNGIKFDVMDVSVSKMKGKRVIFGFCLSQDGKWLDNTWVKLDPVKVVYDPAWWKGNAFWFAYTYEEIALQADPEKVFWGSFFILNGDTNGQIARKDISFSLYDEIGSSGSDTIDTADTTAPETVTDSEERAFHNTTTLVADDFSKNSLDDPSRWICFGNTLFSVKAGVLKADLDSNLWNNMALLNIFPCYGKNSTLSFDARWTDGTGASLAVLTDWRYTHAGRRTIFYIHFNENSITSWNASGAETTQVTFKKGQWARFCITRKNSIITLYVNNKKIVEKKIDPLSPIYNDAQESEYGGYGFETDIRPYRQVYEIDNLMVSGDPSPAAFAGITRKFSISPVDSRPYCFSIIFEKEYAEWAKAQMEISVPYIKSLAEIMGVPAINPNLGMVLCRGSYFYGGAGFNSRGTVYQYGENRNGAALSSHELAHNWYHLYGNKWSMEGAADFGYYVYLEKEKKRLMQAADFLFNRETVGDKAMLKAGRDFVLDNDDAAAAFFNNGMPDWDMIAKMAWKQRVFFYIIYRLTGQEGFRELHKKAVSLGHGMTSKELQDFVGDITGKNAASLFKGWVFSGKALIPLESVFIDTDDDGLCDLDESLWATAREKIDTDDDGFGDFGEISEGFDPLDPGSPGKKAVIIDGIFSDWKNVPQLEDIISIRSMADIANSRLVICAEFYASQGSGSGESYFTLDIDTDGDADADYRVNIFYDKKNSVNSFKTNGYTGARWDPEKWTGLDASAVKYFYCKNLLEVSIPLSLIGNAKTFFLYISSGSSGGTDWFDAAPVKVQSRNDYMKFPAAVFFR